MSKCLYCHKELKAHEIDFHAHCSRTFFGDSVPPTLNYSHDEMDSLAAAIIQSQTTLTGVQPKISLHLNQHEGSKRLTIVGLWGGYIFKPQTELYPHLPELEDVTMHLAEESKLAVVPHSLIRLRDGELGYITQRIDRQADGTKIAMEDMCQLTERPTEYKYRSSHEQVAKAIRKFSSVPDLDVMQYYELVLFCWLTGNNDMHLKNFSIYQPTIGEYRLAPAYDLLNVAIVNPKDTEELALTLNGKKRKLTRHDFETAMLSSGLNEKVVSNIFRKFLRIYPQWEATIRASFLPEDLQEAYWQLIQQRILIIQNS
ncbi:MAG: HipA domain-containing protein [Paludibacteraceae bacterium]|nr:HipA domain-containing protein [Paludibacteraceae bacterium]MBO5012970.1 HipA domain-containing protein [Paludibacteraceae bacterium]MBP3575546.1 HipA domain-containing protein [Paludibacteraceae bacterium]